MPGFRPVSTVREPRVAHEDRLSPMSLEEFHDRIRRAEEDIAAGRVISNEDMGKWINGLR
jgi:predicted transcriptional regulator